MRRRAQQAEVGRGMGRGAERWVVSDPLAALALLAGLGAYLVAYLVAGLAADLVADLVAGLVAATVVGWEVAMATEPQVAADLLATSDWVGKEVPGLVMGSWVVQGMRLEATTVAGPLVAAEMSTARQHKLPSARYWRWCSTMALSHYLGCLSVNENSAPAACQHNGTSTSTRVTRMGTGRGGRSGIVSGFKHRPRATVVQW